MSHRVYGRRLGRDKNQRTALFKGLVRSLFLHESITTTESKAKAIKGLVDHIISKGKEETEASKRVVYSLVSQPEVSKKLLDDIAPRYKNRTSGFTSIIKLGRRSGDGAMLVKMSLVEEGKKEVSDKNKELSLEKIEEVEKAVKPKKGGSKSKKAYS